MRRNTVMLKLIDAANEFYAGNNAGKQQASSRRRSIEGRRPQESKKPKSVWQKANKLLFGWSRTVFKVNGKKLEPCSHILWRFMVST